MTADLLGELPDHLERAAADLWRAENPQMSVFDCDATIMDKYRRRVLAEQPGGQQK